MSAKYKSKLQKQDRTDLGQALPLDTPFLLYVDPSSACNFRCNFCPSGHQSLIRKAGIKPSILDFSLYKKLIDGLHEFPEKIKVIRFNKIGEPLLNPYIVKMLRYAKESGRVESTHITTNGAKLTRKLSTEIIDAGVDVINISIEGVSSAQYKAMCNVDIDFKKLVENLTWLFAQRKGTKVNIKIPGNYLTQAERDRFFELFSAICDSIFVENLSPIWPNFDVAQSGLFSLSESHQYGEDLSEKMVCTYLFYSLAINADGTVSACCPDWEQKLIVGDLKSQSINTIWAGDRLRELQLAHLHMKRGEVNVCNQCGHIRYCQVDSIDNAADMILQRMQR